MVTRFLVYYSNVYITLNKLKQHYSLIELRVEQICMDLYRVVCTICNIISWGKCILTSNRIQPTPRHFYPDNRILHSVFFFQELQWNVFLRILTIVEGKGRGKLWQFRTRTSTQQHQSVLNEFINQTFISLVYIYTVKFQQVSIVWCYYF